MASCKQPDYTIIPEHVFVKHIWPHFHHRFCIIVWTAEYRQNADGPKYGYNIKYKYYDSWYVTFQILPQGSGWTLKRVHYNCKYYNISIFVGGNVIDVNENGPSKSMIRCLRELYNAAADITDKFDPKSPIQWIDVSLLKPLAKCDNRPAKLIEVLTVDI